ncbi:MAG TPA: ABC transporter permease [Thermoplasmata archaeon]|nr:ABC transporter permease [Thermoplasmata archaeon]
MSKKRSFRGIISRKVLNMIITILGIMTLNFFLIHLMPGEPILNMVPRDPKFDDSLKWELMEKFNLNESLPEQYLTYMYNAITLDWGTSYMANSRPVLDIIVGDMRWTMLLVGASTIFTILIGMVIGAYSAFRRGGPFDLGASAISLFFYGMPVFWFAIILQMLFTSYPLGLNWWPQFPLAGYYDTDTYGAELKWTFPVVLSMIKHLIVPSLTLAFATVAGISLVMRSSLIDVFTEDYILTARAKGCSDMAVLRRHALPNGLPPIVALIAMDIAFIIGGAYQVEVIFNYPGIGWRTIKSIYELDFPILQFIIVIGGVAVVIANFIGDLVLLYIDPRIKMT